MAETVLVTGGTGFVASWCIVQLLERGYVVRTTVRNLSKEGVVRKTISALVDPADRLTFFAADLTSDTGWEAAVADCDYVLHVASPLGVDNPKDADAVIIPAREGTLRVLRAATQANVKRIVLTSSIAAANPPLASADSMNDENKWTDPEDPTLIPYRKSKVIAEMAAWEFMKNHKGPTTLTTILPGAIFGPILSVDNMGSVQVISRLLKGSVPGYPNLGFDIIDVRDVADMHIRAMTSSEAAGERFIAASEFMWMREVCAMLRAKLGSSASKVPTRGIPDFVLRFLSLFDPAIQVVTPNLGHKHLHSSAKAQRLLGWHPRPSSETVLDCAESLIVRNAI